MQLFAATSKYVIRANVYVQIVVLHVLAAAQGNKGGVGVRLELYDTSICFVNSHLAAHMQEIERRNQDFRDINNKMNFGARNPQISISDHE